MGKDIMKEIQEVLLRLSIENEKSKIEAEKSRKESEKSRIESEKRWAKLEKQYGYFGNFIDNDGDVVEEYFYTALDKSNKLHGEDYNYFSHGEKYSLKKGEEREFDIIGYNGDKITTIEVKKIVHKNDVKKLIEKQLPFLKKYMKDRIKYKNHRIYGGIAGFKINKDAEDYARKHGIIILTKNSKNKLEELTKDDEIKAI